MRLSRLLIVMAIPWLLCAFPPAASSSELPDFMEHWEFGWNIDEDAGPSYFSDILFPLRRDPDGESLIFLEPRFTFADSEWLTNIGWGYRKLPSP